jgi:hypothetical protein
VLDTSSIIEVDSFFDSPDSASAGNDALDDVLGGMLELASAGRIVLPSQVRDECKSPRVREFAEAAYRECSDLQPSYESLREVMAVAGNLIALNDERDVADPWVLAQALELGRSGHETWVVTEDRRDRPPKKISLMSAARRLDLPAVRVFHLLREEEILR